MGNQFFGEGQIACPQIQDGRRGLFRQQLEGIVVLTNEWFDGLSRLCRERPLCRLYRAQAKEDTECAQGLCRREPCQLLERFGGGRAVCGFLFRWQGGDDATFDLVRKGRGLYGLDQRLEGRRPSCRIDEMAGR